MVCIHRIRAHSPYKFLTSCFLRTNLPAPRNLCIAAEAEAVHWLLKKRGKAYETCPHSQFMEDPLKKMNTYIQAAKGEEWWMVAASFDLPGAVLAIPGSAIVPFGSLLDPRGPG